MQYTKEEVQAIIRILKSRFNNLTAEQLIELAFEILNALNEVRKNNDA